MKDKLIYISQVGVKNQWSFLYPQRITYDLQRFARGTAIWRLCGSWTTNLGLRTLDILYAFFFLIENTFQCREKREHMWVRKTFEKRQIANINEADNNLSESPKTILYSFKFVNFFLIFAFYIFSHCFSFPWMWSLKKGWRNWLQSLKSLIKLSSKY